MLVHHIVTSSTIRHIDESLRFSKICAGLEPLLEISFIVAIGDYKWLVRDAWHVAVKSRVEMMTVFRFPVLCIFFELVSEVWLDLYGAPDVFPR